MDHKQERNTSQIQAYNCYGNPINDNLWCEMV